jgi:hypothetical protein
MAIINHYPQLPTYTTTLILVFSSSFVFSKVAVAAAASEERAWEAASVEIAQSKEQATMAEERAVAAEKRAQDAEVGSSSIMDLHL